MSEPASISLQRLGLVVHPTRQLDTALDGITSWASEHGLEIGQVQIPSQTRRVADPVEAAACDLLVAVGGDGTALTALHLGATASRPVLAIACGSVGALTSVHADQVGSALDQIAASRWSATALAGLDIAWGDEPGGVAINDLAIVRDGSGQVIVSITVDDVLYARVAGDGLVVATALGSSAYTIAAGGPILGPGAEGMAITPLAPHGGSCPPLVAGAASRLTLAVEPGYGGVRYEIDGRPATGEGNLLTLRHRPEYASLVTLADEEPRLTALRTRGLVVDSPRVVVREGRSAE